MAWPTIKPEDVLGMSTEDFKGRMGRLDTVVTKDELTAVKTEITNSVADTIKNALRDLQIGSQQQQQQQQQQVVTQPEALPSFIDDEENAFNSRFRREAKPLLDMVLNTGQKTAYDSVKTAHMDFNLFEDEIKQELEKAPAAFKTNAQYVENCYFMVRGRHADEIRQDTMKREGKYFVESGGSQANNMLNNTNAKPTLTDDEKKYCEKFNMTEDEYIKSKGALKYV